MNYVISLFLSFFLTVFISCKNDDTGISGNGAKGNSEAKKSRFMIATRPGAYEPKGLRKLSILEMKEMGQKGLVEFNFVCKDEKGNVVESNYYSNGPEPRFMQMYVNENDVVVEAVIMEMSDEIKSIMAMMRFVSL
jgi:hypothetical protein